MPRIIQVGGSTTSNIASQLGQGLLAYQAGLSDYKKREAQAKESNAKLNYYQSLGAKAEADAAKVQGEADVLSARAGALSSIYNKYGMGSGAGSGMRGAPTPVTAPGAPMGTASPLPQSGQATEDGSGFGDIYYSPDFDNVRGRIEGGLLPGALDDPGIRAALLDRGKTGMYEELLSVDPKNAAEYRRQLDAETEEYANRVDSEINRYNNAKYAESLAEFKAIMSGDDVEMDAVYSQKLEDEVISQLGVEDGIDSQEAYWKVQKLRDDYAIVQTARVRGKAINSSLNGIFSDHERYQRIVSALGEAGPLGVDSMTPEEDATALLSRLRSAQYVNLEDPKGAREWLAQLTEDYDEVMMADQGMRGRWIRASQVSSTLQSSAELWERQRQAEIGLMEIRQSNPEQYQAITSQLMQFYQAPVDSTGLTKQQEHALRMDNVEREMNALFIAQGRQGLSRSGYAQLIEAPSEGILGQTVKEEVPQLDTVRSLRGYTPKAKVENLTSMAEGAIERRRARGDEARDRKPGSKADWLGIRGTVGEFRDHLRDYLREANVWSSHHRDRAGQFSKLPKDKREHFLLYALQELEPTWEKRAWAAHKRVGKGWFSDDEWGAVFDKATEIQQHLWQRPSKTRRFGEPVFMDPDA